MNALVYVLVPIVCGQGPVESRPVESRPAGLNPAKAAIKVVIDAGKGQVTTYSGVPFAKDMNVIAALKKLKSRGLKFESRGSGVTAFVESINGLKNTGSGKNWIFYVNDKKSTVGAGVCILKPDDVVLWKYTDKIE